MINIRGVYEIVVRVKDLARAESFYRDVLGFDDGLRNEEKKSLFLRVGGQAGMLVLQEDRNEWPLQHFAFTVDESEIERAASLLRERGIEVQGPRFHEWIPARSLYFEDPDGHNLELCAPLGTQD